MTFAQLYYILKLSNKPKMNDIGSYHCFQCINRSSLIQIKDDININERSCVYEII